MKLWVPGESSEALRLDVRAAHGDGEGGREGGLEGYTTVLPQAMGAQTALRPSSNAAFQGAIPTTTP